MDRDINFLHINASDVRWGASIAGFRLHKALLDRGFGSHILCGLKEYKGKDTSPLVPFPFGFALNALVGKLFNSLGLQSFGYPSSFFLKHSHRVREWADVIILRNLHWWYISLGILPRLSRQCPLIWRLPDMWAFTGHCIYSYGCNRWETGCGNCPALRDYPELSFDTTHFLWLRKKRIYERLKGRLAIVSPSQWLAEKVRRSPLLESFRCEVIPSAVDLDIFRPYAKQDCRRQFGIPEDRKVIMVSSFKLGDKRKGTEDVVEVINNLAEKVDYPLCILLAGKTCQPLPLSSKVKAIMPGYVSDDSLLARMYSASDVYFSMSKADNLPNTLIEAAACGVPIITLDSGGCREAIKQEETGYAVKSKNEAVSVLGQILRNGERREIFSKEARKFAEDKFSMEGQVRSYVNLSRELLKKGKEKKGTGYFFKYGG